jgi:hypothetical protein
MNSSPLWDGGTHGLQVRCCPGMTVRAGLATNAARSSETGNRRAASCRLSGEAPVGPRWSSPDPANSSRAAKPST